MFAGKSQKRDKNSYYQIIDEESEGDADYQQQQPPNAFSSFPSPYNAADASTSGTLSPEVEPPSLSHDLFGAGPPEDHTVVVPDPVEGQRILNGITSSRYSSASRRSRADGGKKKSTRRRWDHVENLDEFFTRVYEYHQRGGFWPMLASEVFSFLQFIFVVSFSTFLLQCVDYGVLFKNKPVNATTPKPAIVSDRKRTLSDAVIGNCASHLHPVIIGCLFLAVLFWVLRGTRVLYQMLQFREIRNFYENALNIPSAEIDNMTWHEVLQRLKQVQPELQLIINRVDLTELDVYQRILRHKNYLVAMVNKGLLPPRLTFPFLGETAFLSNGFKLNLEWLLFWGPWSPWKGPYALRDEYKTREYLPELATHLGGVIFWVGVTNLLLSPVIFVWQILHSFFTYAEQIKREPGALGTRCFSNYGRYYFRHLNELDHELNMRLNRGYRPSMQYMDMFVSRIGELVAKNVAFVMGAFLAALFLLSAWDEDVLEVEHVLTAMTVCGFAVVACRVFIADENLVWCPEWLMGMIIAQVHYAPDTWKGRAHTDRTRGEFGLLFQFKVYYVLEELLSPIITPFILLFWLRPKAKGLVEFFHKYTVDVDGLGDVCSYSQMDLRKHGDPKWNGLDSHDGGPMPLDPLERAENRATDGKVEMSLIHFTLANPTWSPPNEAALFLDRLRERAEKDIANIRDCQAAATDNAMLQSLHAFAPLQCPPFQFSRLGTVQQPQQQQQLLRGRGVANAEVIPGPLVMQDSQTSSQSGYNNRSLMRSLSGVVDQSDVFLRQQSVHTPNQPVLDGAAAEMSLHALFLHELHAQRSQMRGYGSVSGAADHHQQQQRRHHRHHHQPQQQQQDQDEHQFDADGEERDLWGVPAQSVMAQTQGAGIGPRLHLLNEESTTLAGSEMAPSVFRST